jgi:hypothetical protein
MLCPLWLFAAIGRATAAAFRLVPAVIRPLNLGCDLPCGETCAEAGTCAERLRPIIPILRAVAKRCHPPVRPLMMLTASGMPLMLVASALRLSGKPRAATNGLSRSLHPVQPPFDTAV